MFTQVLVSLIFSQQVFADDVKGYYMQSWKGESKGPSDTNMMVYFSGHNSIKKAFAEMPKSYDSKMPDDAWFTFGGGNKNGYLSVENIKAFAKDIQRIKDKGFVGVMWDVEWVKDDSSIQKELRDAFAKVKKAGLDNGITVSHTAPYKTGTENGIDFISSKDQTALMKALLKDEDKNVDIMSPQLYTFGRTQREDGRLCALKKGGNLVRNDGEPCDKDEPDFAVTGSCAPDCGWDLYKNMRTGMKLVPSIIHPSHYDTAKKGLEKRGLTSSGYIVWEQCEECPSQFGDYNQDRVCFFDSESNRLSPRRFRCQASRRLDDTIVV
jgi:hypothetical protein